MAPPSTRSNPSARRNQPGILTFVALLIVILALAVGGFLALEETSDETDTELDLVQRACDLPRDNLLRMWRGYDPQATEDIMVVPREPNYWGTYDRVSHTGPWDYVQRVPLVFYGPGRISALGAPLKVHANVTDVYPTIAELVG